MPSNPKLIFIAGGAGLAGSSIIQAILRECPRTKIRASVYRHSKPWIKDQRVRYVRCDLSLPKDCRKAVRGCDAAVMAAAYTGGASFVTTHPWEHIRANLSMIVTMLESFHLEKVRRVVCVGSATLYQASAAPLAEDELDLNRDPNAAYFGYGWTGRYIEKLCEFWHRQYGLKILIARSANIYGPYARFDPRRSNFIPAIIRKAADRMEPFDVWGSPLAARDVIYSADFGSAIAAMVRRADIAFDVFNVASGTKTKVEQVVRLALKYANHCPRRIRYVSRGPATMRSLLLDPSKAARVLGWKARHTLAEGIEKTTRWWAINKGSYNR
jgi:GDP-L-fucose synthase